MYKSCMSVMRLTRLTDRFLMNFNRGQSLCVKHRGVAARKTGVLVLVSCKLLKHHTLRLKIIIQSSVHYLNYTRQNVAHSKAEIAVFI